MVLALFTRPANSTRSPIPHRPLFHTPLVAPLQLLRLLDFLHSRSFVRFHCSLHLRTTPSCAPATPCASTVRCISTTSCTPRVLAPSRLIAQYIAIASGQFYWAMHPMSSQQSLAIWVSHFFESARFPTPSSFISSITFLETLLPQPSFRGKDTKKGYSAVLVRCTPVANTDSGTIEANRG